MYYNTRFRRKLLLFFFSLLLLCTDLHATTRIGSGQTTAEINSIINKAKPGERIVFEKGAYYFVNEQILFVGLEGNTIDFNGCTFTLAPDNKFVPKSIAGYYVGDVILFFAGCKKIKIKGLNVDGKRTLCSIDNELTAIEFTNSSGSVQDLLLKNCSCHHIIIGEHSNLHFKRIQFENLGCSGGNSDVYVYRKEGIKTSWKDIRSFRPIVEGENNTGQVFYFSGGNNRVKNLYCENCHATIDQRSGQLNAKRIVAKNCCGFYVISSGNQPQHSEASIIISDVVLYDVCPSKNNSSAFFISSTQSCHLKNFEVYLKKEKSPAFANIQIRQFNNGQYVNSVSLENIHFHYQDGSFPQNGIVFNNLDQCICLFSGVQMSSSESKVFAIDCKEKASFSFRNVQVLEAKTVFSGNSRDFVGMKAIEKSINN